MCGPANALGRRAEEEIGIRVAQREGARPLVDRIVRLADAQVGQRNQARRIGVVHQQAVAIAVHFIRPDLAKSWMIHSPRLRSCLRHFIRQRPGLRRKRRILSGIACQFCKLTERLHGKQIGRHKKWKGARIVRRTKHAEDHSVRARRVSESRKPQSVVGRKSLALETIGAGRLLALLFLKRANNRRRCGLPLRIEWTAVARRLPITVCQTNGIAQRIDLPFALTHARVVVGAVVHGPRQRSVRWIRA